METTQMLKTGVNELKFINNNNNNNKNNNNDNNNNSINNNNENNCDLNAIFFLLPEDGQLPEFEKLPVAYT
jgi:hypothetical protein